MKSFTLLQRLLCALAIGGVALALGLAGAGGSYALWNARATSGTSTIVSGSAAITSTPLSGPSVALFPGSTSYQTAVITNSGTVPLTIQARSLVLTSATTVFSSALQVSVGMVTAATDCNPTFVKAWTGTIGTLPPTGLGVTVPAVATATLCIAVSLPLLAPAGSQLTTTPTFVLTVGGVQPS